MLCTIPVEPKSTVSDPTAVTTGVNHTVTAASNYIVNVTPTVDDVVITVSSGRSHRILNSSTTKRLIVDSTIAANVTAQPGQAVDVMWDSAANQHRTFLFNSASTSGAVTTVYTQAGHGRGFGEIGRPVSNGALFVDTDITTWPTGILTNVIDTSNFEIAVTGDIVTLFTALLDGGVGINLSLGRNVWWDASAALYKQTRQNDAIKGVPALLYILSVGATTFQAVVRPMVAVPWRAFTEYTLTGTDITNKGCSVIPAGVAIDGLVYAGGILLSSADATFNALTGVVDWTGKALDGRAVAGMKMQGMYEPFL